MISLGALLGVGSKGEEGVKKLPDCLVRFYGVTGKEGSLEAEEFGLKQLSGVSLWSCQVALGVQQALENSPVGGGMELYAASC